MRVENIVFDIQDNRISFENGIGPLNTRKWAIDLLPDKIIYSSKKRTSEFRISDIQELQYEADTFGKYDLQDAGSAYVILKDKPEPQYFFYIVVNQPEFVPMSKTHASIICDQVLSFIGNKYGIPCNCKISIETKAKQNRMGWVVLCFILLPLLWWLYFHYM